MQNARIAIIVSIRGRNRAGRVLELGERGNGAKLVVVWAQQ